MRRGVDIDVSQRRRGRQGVRTAVVQVPAHHLPKCHDPAVAFTRVSGAATSIRSNSPMLRGGWDRPAHRPLRRAAPQDMSFGRMGALTRAPIGVIRAMTETRRLLERCMEEVDAVAEARRVALAPSVVADTMAFLDSLAENATTSLQRDIIDGKPSELEAWNGAVVRLA